jgi:anti-sigma B factor antagonist
MYSRSPVIVMEVPAELTHAEGKEFLHELQPLLEDDHPRVVLDCSRLQYIDSAGIEMLLQCMEEAMKRDGDVKLAAVSPATAAILELMRVDRVFEMFESTEQAAASFHPVPPPEVSQLPWYSAAYAIGGANSAT